MTEKADALRDEFFTEKEISSALIEELKISLSTRDRDVSVHDKVVSTVSCRV